MKNKYLSFCSARKIVCDLGIKNNREWRVFCKKLKPTNIPSSPDKYYKNRGWISWGDWLKNNNESNWNRKYRSFEDAILFVRCLGLQSQMEWMKWASTNYRPKDIPFNPYRTYRKEWVSFGYWLGNNKKVGGFRGGRKYKVNDDYFKKWSHNMAYILGLWFTDGCIYKNQFSISLHKNDQYLLRKILKEMKSNYPLYKNRNNLEIKIASNVIVNDIMSLGGKYRKSLNIIFPHIPKKYIFDFIRGIWDGDGSVYFHRNKKYYKYIESSFSSSSRRFVSGLNKILKKYYIGLNAKIKVHVPPPLIRHRLCKKNLKVIYLKHNHYTLTLCANDTRRLRNLIYKKDCLLKLKRKYKIFEASGELFFGTKTFVDFSVAKKFFRSKNIKNCREWVVFCKKQIRPFNIPSDPRIAYKNKGWISWPDFLGIAN